MSSKICFLITAHKNYNQMIKLINHLRVDFDLYIHIDKKSKLQLDSFDNVRVYKKFKVHHGGFSQIITTLFLMEEAIKNNYDRYIFISAQDIPLKSNVEIIDFFDKNIDKEFISFENIRNSDGLFNEMSYRLNTYNFGFWYRKLLNKKLRVAISNIPFIKRETPENIYYGSNWWCLTKEAVLYILEYVEKNNDFLNRFNYTWGSDEFFFQSILLESSFKERCVNNCLRYLVWSGGVPITFRLSDYDRIKKEGEGDLFSRKFDEKVDSDIIDKLYKDLS